MSELNNVVAATHETIRPFATGSPERGEWESRLEAKDRAFTMEAVYEGFLMHYGESRAFSAEMDPDLRLLAGDSLYALGLERLAQNGDLAAVAELADLISVCAQAQAEGRTEEVRGFWEATLQRFSA
jgi:hypothetical protein